MKRLVNMSALILSAFAMILLNSARNPAQDLMQQPDLKIDAGLRAEVIEGVLKQLNEGYVFPEVAQKMEKSIRERAEKKEYDGLTSAIELARKLTSDLQEISHDKHLRVGYSSEVLPPQQEDGEPGPEERERFRSRLKIINFGFEKAERLPGNIGYLELRGFVPAEFGSETAVAAMNFLANTDALIIDLRRNGGGDPAMVAMISSYLFDSEPVHLNSLYWRPANTTHQWWTLPFVPGQRYGRQKEVYVLTSKRTFSAAEEFTYNLQNLKRATIVGETTGGGAHPGGTRRVNDHFQVWVPSGRAINPISGTNWEGTGVKPDVDVPADQAFKTAQLMALKRVMDKTSDQGLKEQLKSIMEDVEKDLDNLKKNQPTRP